jgi:hypothetical protein
MTEPIPDPDDGHTDTVDEATTPTRATSPTPTTR